LERGSAKIANKRTETVKGIPVDAADFSEPGSELKYGQAASRVQFKLKGQCSNLELGVLLQEPDFASDLSAIITTEKHPNYN
jgi:hypothetical protein